MVVSFFERRDPGEECRNCLLLPPRLQPDWMLGRLHFDGVEDSVGIFRVGAAPHFVRKIAPRVSFHIQFTAALQLRTEFDVPASIDNRVHIHVTRDVRRELGAIACKHIDHARRQIAGRDNFGKCERRQRFRGRDEHDGAVAAQDYWRDQRDKLKQRGSSGQMTTTTPVGSGIVKLKCELATGFTAPKIWPNLSVQPA